MIHRITVVKAVFVEFLRRIYDIFSTEKASSSSILRTWSVRLSTQLFLVMIYVLTLTSCLKFWIKVPNKWIMMWLIQQATLRSPYLCPPTIYILPWFADVYYRLSIRIMLHFLGYLRNRKGCVTHGLIKISHPVKCMIPISTMNTS